MSPVHFSLPRLLLLLHATAATVLGDAIINETADMQNVTDGDMTVSIATTNRPTEKITVIPKGTSHPVVRAMVHLYCLENGTKVLVCEPGRHQAAPIQWTLDGKDLEETQADFQHNSKTITLATGVLGNISCKIRDNAAVMPSSSINTACDARPRVRLFCLENGTKVLVCDPGRHQAASIQWTLDGKDLEETQADFQHNNQSITLATGVLGNISCKIRDDAAVMASLPIKPACDGETWIFYSTIMATAGGGAFLLSLIVCAAACCCRRRSGHLPLKQEEIELGPVFVEEKKPKVKEVHEVEETTPMTNRTTPNVETAEDGFHFPTPPDMNCLTPEEDGKVTMEERQNTSATGSEDISTDGHEDKMAENECSDVDGN